ncbi:hypothetical protein BSLG_005328 [Batrachochytrium salamandrivorans]|nr:hypothetical protein BSLG_005328 [Batrachochytrium salamandrivorans]
MRAHVICLSGWFIQHEQRTTAAAAATTTAAGCGETCHPLLPVSGTCPICRLDLAWGTLVSDLRSRVAGFVIGVRSTAPVSGSAVTSILGTDTAQVTAAETVLLASMDDHQLVVLSDTDTDTDDMCDASLICVSDLVLDDRHQDLPHTRSSGNAYAGPHGVGMISAARHLGNRDSRKRSLKPIMLLDDSHSDASDEENVISVQPGSVVSGVTALVHDDSEDEELLQGL